MLLGMGGRGFFLLFACAWLFLSPSASWGEFIQERQVDRNFQSGLQDSETGSAFMTSEWAKIPGGLSGMAEYVDGEVLVKFKETTSLYMAEQVCYRKQMSVARRYKALSNKGNGQYMLFRANMSTSEMIEALREDPSVEAVSPNYIRYAYSAPDDPEYPLWGLQKIGAEAAWDINTGSSDVIVANIDSGVDYTHVDLAANMWTNTAETPGDGMDNDGNGYVDDIYGINAIADDGDPMDDNDHGSHTAGTTGAVGDNGKLLTGVNWNVSTMALKFLNAGGTGEDADAIECINYVIDQKNKGQNIVAVNASYGGPGYSEVMKGVISDLGDEGIIFCAAAGNGGNDQIGDNNDRAPSYPDSYDLDNIISVAASNSSDELAGFSNYGVSTVDLAAPGVDILSTIPGFSPRDIFFDDMESGDGNWVHGGTNDSWAITTEEQDNCPSPTHTWSDSPNGDYIESTNEWLEVNQSIDLSAYQEETLYFGFWADYEIESGFDELVIEFSGDGGQGWLSRLNIDGSGPQYYDIEISDGFKINNFKFRFRLVADSLFNYDGVYIDDVGIGMNSGSNRTASWPGTSMATPHVAGAVALMAAQYPGEDMLTRKNRVLSGVEHIGGLEGKVSTEGRLNLANSIDSNLEFSPLITGSVKDGLVPGSSFTLTGIEFGSSEGEVLFSDNTTDKTARVESWSDSSVSGVVPQDAGRYIQINDAAGNSSGIIRGTAWKEMQSAPTALAAGTGVAYEGKVYQFGGADGPAYANATDTAGYYDPLSDTASEVTQMPAQRMLQGSAVLNDSIYVLGGVDESSSVYPSVWCYDPVGDSWSNASSMPEPLMALQAVSLNGTLYAIGGGVSSCTDAVYAYDPNSGTWTQKASMNEARMYHGAVTHNGKIYVFGGQNGSGTLSSCEVYDPQSNSWTSLPAMPRSLYAFGITSDGEDFFIIGGNYSAGILRFDPATEDWSSNTNSLLDLPKGISYASVAFLPHYGHILFGGRDTANLFNEIYCLDLYAPDHVSGLSANQGDGEVSLSWTNPNVDFSGCKVSVSPGSQPIDVGNASQYTVTGLTNDQEYTFELVAYDDMSNETAAVNVSATPQAADSGDDGDSGDDTSSSSGGGGGGCFIKILQD